MKRLLLLAGLLALVSYVGISNNLITIPDTSLPSINKSKEDFTARRNLVSEESTVIDAIDKALPSVVTIGISKTTTSRGFIELDPLDPFNPFKRVPGKSETIERNIGSGFIISSDGLIVTNKHVVADREAIYNVLTNDNKTYEVKEISRDPLNDIAIIKISTKGLQPLELGDSSNLKLGQYVIAIGTPLGEFQNTVTSGIVSGLGRGITAGSPYEGFVERLDDVIQTDAAISPGNSGGPLINIAGQVIGVNTAVSQSGENLGFAIPINIVSDLLENYTSSGGIIQRPFFGVRYQMINKQNAILNEVPEGAYVVEIIEKSGAERAGIEVGDIITTFDGKRLSGDENNNLGELIAKKKAGNKIRISIYRSEKSIEKTVTLGFFE